VVEVEILMVEVAEVVVEFILLNAHQYAEQQVILLLLEQVVLEIIQLLFQ
jgi:hypothetical protein